MSELIRSAPSQPPFEGMSHSAREHHLRTAHGRRGSASPQVHRVLHEVIDWGRAFDDLEPDAQRVALVLASRPHPQSWDAGVHHHGAETSPDQDPKSS